METLLQTAVVILILIVFCLMIKIYLMRKTVREIEEEFSRRLAEDTNTLIGISHQDRAMRNLADSINRQLRSLRSQRHLYLQGDLELKEAITNISHDLRTPLTSICGYLELIKREELPKNAVRYVQQIENRTEAMKQLTEELFRYSVVSSVRELQQVEVNVKGVLEDVLISFLGAMEQRGISPEIHMTESPVVRRLDVSALQRIFSNIVSNALKYSDGDLKVILSGQGEVTFSNRAQAMDSVTAARLFDRFYTVETARNSTGLGLSIAKLLTERMGGAINASYRDGRLYISLYFPEN